MRSNSSFSVRRLVLAGLMAALTVAGSALRITVPIDIAGTSSFHLGNILCAISGILLGPWLGGAAAGLGSAIYDMLNPLYISEAWLTFLTKGLYAVAAGLVAHVGAKRWGYPRALLATVTGAVVYALVYLLKSYFYNGLLLHGLTHEAAMVTLVTKLPPTVFNALVAIIAAPLLAVAIKKALVKSHIQL